jgi:hypothetical protein
MTQASKRLGLTSVAITLTPYRVCQAEGKFLQIAPIFGTKRQVNGPTIHQALLPF